MAAQQRIPLRAQPVAKARVNSRSSASRGCHRTHEVRQRQKHQEHHPNAVDDNGKDVQASFHAVPPHELNKRVHKREQDKHGTSCGQGRKSKSRHPLGYPRHMGGHDYQYSEQQAEPADPFGGKAPARFRVWHRG